MIARGSWWAQPPANVILLQDDVHVWCASLDQPASGLQWLAQTLSADERVRAERFYFEQDGMRFIVGRGLLRIILGYYLGIEPSELRFCYSSRGRPTLAETTGGNRIRFNLAHSLGLALYAVTLGREIGVDLECIRIIDKTEQIVDRFFSDREKAVFRALPLNKKYEAFFTYWTCKEAYLKACGEGLSQPLDQIDVLLVPGEPTRLLSIKGDVREASRWSLQELRPASGFAAALVVEGHSYCLSCWQWSQWPPIAAASVHSVLRSTAHIGA